MKNGITVKRQFHVRRGRSNRRRCCRGAKPTVTDQPRSQGFAAYGSGDSL